nr:MAG TPA: hypothetical protein [Caudoviricetes sp.]
MHDWSERKRYTIVASLPRFGRPLTQSCIAMKASGHDLGDLSPSR